MSHMPCLLLQVPDNDSSGTEAYSDIGTQNGIWRPTRDRTPIRRDIRFIFDVREGAYMTAYLSGLCPSLRWQPLHEICHPAS